MAIVRGHFTTIIRPGLRQVWAGTQFAQSQHSALFIPQQRQPMFGQSIFQMVLDDISRIWVDPDDFDDLDDYEIALFERG